MPFTVCSHMIGRAEQRAQTLADSLGIARCRQFQNTEFRHAPLLLFAGNAHHFLEGLFFEHQGTVHVTCLPDNLLIIQRTCHGLGN